MRASQVAVDMCVMNVQYMNTLSHFFSKGELFHCQMQLLYGLIDVMGATMNVEPQAVLEIARGYFDRLQRERHE